MASSSSSRKPTVGLVYSPLYLEHDDPAHPENAYRLKACLSHLASSGILGRLSPVKVRPADASELGLIHTQEHINYIENLAKQGGGWVDPDTYVSYGSYQAAVNAAGGVIAATEQVVSGSLNAAFALVRPPGHHATRDRAMGFCLFNNIAIAAAYALEHLGLERIVIIDFDVHHGNGTEATFYHDPRVLYVSTHQYPFYPGTGAAEDTGAGDAMGTNVNLPLPAGCGDKEYLRVFNEVAKPVVGRFHPQLILVSAGYDAHWADPLAQMQLSIGGFAEIVRLVGNLASQNSLGTVWALEGGYHLGALASAVEATLRVLMGEDEAPDTLGPPPNPYPTPDIQSLVSRFKAIHDLP